MPESIRRPAALAATARRLSRFAMIALLLACAVAIAARRAHAGPLMSPAYGPYSAIGDVQCVRVADLNHDGTLDVIVSEEFGNDVAVYLGAGNGSLAGRVPYSGLAHPCAVAVADFNEDGKPDVATAFGQDIAVMILVGVGDGTFVQRKFAAVNALQSAIAVGDLNGDGHLDFAVTLPELDAVGIALGVGNGTFGACTQYPTGDYPGSIRLADLNHDGKLDIVVGTINGNVNGTAPNPALASVLTGNGNGTFQPKQDYLGPNGPVTDVEAADLNNDGIPDLEIANGYRDSLSWFPGNGDGTFGTRTAAFIGSHGPQSLATADFDGDGVPDLAIGCSNTRMLILRGGTGGVQPGWLEFSAAGDVGAIASANLDGTGGPDLVAEINTPPTTGIYTFLNTGAPVVLGVPPAPGVQGTLRATVTPNPVGAAADVAFSLPAAATVTARIFDVTGRRVATLLDGAMGAGPHSTHWNLRDDSGLRLAAGMYVVELRVGAARTTTRFAVLR